MSVNKNDKARQAAPDWRRRALAATRSTQFGAIIREAMRCYSHLPDDGASSAEAESNPRFVGAASITSDGYVMCDFIDRDGNGHPGAFVGSVDDLVSNIAGLIAHLGLLTPESDAFVAVMQAWIALDYRSQPGLRLPASKGE